MPTVVQKFSRLKILKLYNATVIWDSDAVLTDARHPRLQTLFFVRIKLPPQSLATSVAALTHVPRLLTAPCSMR